MKMTSDAVKYYREKLITLSELREKAKVKRSWLAGGRLVMVLAAIAFGYVAWDVQQVVWILPLLVALVIFGRVLAWDVDNNARIRRLDALKGLVTQEMDFLVEGKPIPGNDVNYANGPEHAYAYDLDIFGKGSLFALLNRSPSEPGKNLLARWLLAPGTRGNILERQEAIKEWRQDPDTIFELMAIGKETPLRAQTVQRMQDWLMEEDVPFQEKYWEVIRWGYPAISLGVLVFYLIGQIPSSVFGLSFVVFFIISSAFSRRVGRHYRMLSGIVKEVSILSESMALIEGKSFEAPLNKKLQEVLKQPTGASEQIRQLDGLLSRFDYRLNAFIFIFLNAFLIWDLQQMKGLNQWRHRNRKSMEHWVDILAQMETLCSLALLHFNRPHWCFPDIAPTSFEFSGRDLGHPLIPEGKRVNNSFAMEGTGQLELVTGSNMAGKSTFLRTIGVNMVLSMAGGPVCASACKLSVVHVVSSMRIADNLEDSTSTFYAELKKLRGIIDRVKLHEHVFILLDEILRGTNSRDRLAGSKALIQQLVRDEAVGIVATHDLELAQLEEALPGHIHNYYFDVQFYGDQLGFDYKLRQGVCTTKNAELLMRQIGIEL